MRVIYHAGTTSPWPVVAAATHLGWSPADHWLFSHLKGTVPLCLLGRDSRQRAVYALQRGLPAGLVRRAMAGIAAAYGLTGGFVFADASSVAPPLFTGTLGLLDFMGFPAPGSGLLRRGIIRAAERAAALVQEVEEVERGHPSRTGAVTLTTVGHRCRDAGTSTFPDEQRGKVIYHCYGGTHSSVVAAGLHLGLLPRHRVAMGEELLALPRFDRAGANDIGLPSYMGRDCRGFDVYVMGMARSGHLLRDVIDGFLAIEGVSGPKPFFVDTLAAIGPVLKTGGILSRRLGLVAVGRPLAVAGARRYYRRLMKVVEDTERALVRPGCGSAPPPGRQPPGP